MTKKRVKKTTTVVTEEQTINNEKTQIICILDRSGSMSSIIDDAIGGFNQFIEDQKKLEDDASMTVALFDDQYELLYDNIPIPEVENFSKKTWYPRGMTALYDAIGKTINTVKQQHKNLKKKEKPDKVLVCIVTDGHENASEEYDNAAINKLIKECETQKGWSFVYLAANQDAFSVGSSFGISKGNTYTFNADSKGMFNVSSTLTNTANYYRNASSDNLVNSDTLMDEFGVDEDE